MYFQKIMKRVFDADAETVAKLVQVIKSEGNGSAIADNNVRRSLSSVQRRQLDLLLKADTKEESKEGDTKKKEAMKAADDVEAGDKKQVKESVGSFADFLLAEADNTSEQRKALMLRIKNLNDVASGRSTDTVKISVDPSDKGATSDVNMAKNKDNKVNAREELRKAKEQLKQLNSGGSNSGVPATGAGQ